MLGQNENFSTELIKKLNSNIKTVPPVGMPLYLYRKTGSYYVDEVKTPFTVVGVEGQYVLIQSCHLIAPVYHCCGNPYLDRPDLEGQRVFFYDTVAETILPNKYGEIIKLKWYNKKGQWSESADRYSRVACFGEYKHQPYLD